MTQDVHVCLAQMQPFFKYFQPALIESGGAESLHMDGGQDVHRAPTQHLDEKTLVDDTVFYVSYIYLEGKLCKSQESA